jgi:hypothetical protein
MAMAVGWGNRRNQNRESAFGTCDVQTLLFSSHHSEQVGGIPAIQRSPPIIFVSAIPLAIVAAVATFAAIHEA